MIIDHFINDFNDSEFDDLIIHYQLSNDQFQQVLLEQFRIDPEYSSYKLKSIKLQILTSFVEDIFNELVDKLNTMQFNIDHELDHDLIVKQFLFFNQNIKLVNNLADQLDQMVICCKQSQPTIILPVHQLVQLIIILVKIDFV